MSENDVMAIVPRLVVDDVGLQFAIREYVDSRPGEIVRVRFNLGADWAGDVALFMRVLLRDRAVDPSNLAHVTSSVMYDLSAIAQRHSSGCSVYFDFRSESEQARLQDPTWA